MGNWKLYGEVWGGLKSVGKVGWGLEWLCKGCGGLRGVGVLREARGGEVVVMVGGWGLFDR